MAKGYVKCARCGSDFTITANNRREADRYADRLEKSGKLCPDCERHDREAANSAAAKENSSAGLPSLIGSPAQIGWAETIRRGRLDSLALIRPLVETQIKTESLTGDERKQFLAAAREDFAARHPDRNEQFRLASEARELFGAINTIEMFDAFVAVLRGQVRASWWIDNRDLRLDRLANDLRDQLVAALALPPAPEEIEAQAEAEAEAVLKPAGEPVSTTIAEIAHVGGIIRVTFPEKRDDFRAAIKDLGFIWSQTFWSRHLTFKAGNPVDRMAEVANRLVGAGFVVRLFDQEARERAAAGTFAPEQTRWVDVTSSGGYFTGRLHISWRRPDDFYDVARSLPGARYHNGAVYVPPGAVEAVADFADQYGFTMSPAASAMLADHRAALAGGAVVTSIAKAPEAVVATVERQTLVPDADASIDPELLDA